MAKFYMYLQITLGVTLYPQMTTKDMLVQKFERRDQ